MAITMAESLRWARREQLLAAWSEGYFAASQVYHRDVPYAHIFADPELTAQWVAGRLKALSKDSHDTTTQPKPDLDAGTVSIFADEPKVVLGSLLGISTVAVGDYFPPARRGRGKGGKGRSKPARGRAVGYHQRSRRPRKTA